MLHIEPISLLTDNYAYLLHDSKANITAIIDPSEADPILAILKEKNLTLNYILCTHHHWDHTDGNQALKAQTGCTIVGYEADAHRIPDIDITVNTHNQFTLGNHTATILDTPGHTTGHIAYYFADNNAVFVGDTLFAMGCGRLFEGTPAQMYQSIQQLAQLPPNTHVYCGHEYTLANATFALTIEPNNQALQQRYAQIKQLRAEKLPTVPTTIALEHATNPFMRSTSEKIFTERRALKDTFRS